MSVPRQSLAFREAVLRNPQVDVPAMYHEFRLRRGVATDGRYILYLVSMQIRASVGMSGEERGEGAWAPSLPGGEDAATPHRASPPPPSGLACRQVRASGYASVALAGEGTAAEVCSGEPSSLTRS